jgi:acetyl-CoA synthetase
MGYLWTPPQELVEGSNLRPLMERLGLERYESLVRWTIEHHEEFWTLLPDVLGVEWFRRPLETLDISGGAAWAKWYRGGSLNVAYNALERHARLTPTKPALIWRGEDGARRVLTYAQLNEEASRLAGYLAELGVGKGDRVALYLPMLPEAVASLFAALKLGAIAMPIFSGFAPEAVATRLEDAQPKAMVTCDAYLRRGSRVPLLPQAREALRLSGVKAKCIVVRRLDGALEEGEASYEEAVEQGEFTSSRGLDPEHPALLLYSSGTTGRPKGCVISHAGALLQPSKEIHFNLDLKREERLLWVTDIGWMMGPWQIIGAQFLGAAHVLLEGAVDHPPDRLWRIVEEERVTHLGFAATVVRLLRRYGGSPRSEHDLSSLRAFGNTGEPIDPESWLWLMRDVGRERCPIINLSGGTEIFGCFLLPSPLVPLKPSTLWGPGLGMDVDVFDERGRPVRGKVGYLVAKKPVPSMTRGFWRDERRYLETYWSRFEGVWYHGDWALIDEEGYWFLLGRADDVIKVAGKRIGPAELEAVLNAHPSIAESACIGVPHELKGEEVICFVALRGGEGGEALEQELKRRVARALGRAFEPSRVLFVSSLPRTRSGKIMRRLLRAAILGEPLGDLSSLENPEALEEARRAWEGVKEHRVPA